MKIPVRATLVCLSLTLLAAGIPVGAACPVIYRLELSNPRIVAVEPAMTKKDLDETVWFDGFSHVTWTYYELDAKGQVKGSVTRIVPGY